MTDGGISNNKVIKFNLSAINKVKKEKRTFQNRECVELLNSCIDSIQRSYLIKYQSYN